MYRYIDYILPGMDSDSNSNVYALGWGSIHHISKRFFNTSWCVIQFNSDIIYLAIASDCTG